METKTEIFFTSSEETLQEILDTNNTVFLSSPEVKALGKIKKGRFYKEKKIFFTFLYCLVPFISFALFLFLTIVGQSIDFDVSAIPLAVTLCVSIGTLIFNCVFPCTIAKYVSFLLVRIMFLVQSLILFAITIYFSIAWWWECFTTYHLLVFIALMILPIVIFEKYSETLDNMYEYRNYVLLSSNSFALLILVFTGFFNSIHNLHPSYSVGKMQAFMGYGLLGFIALYFIGYGIFSATRVFKDNNDYSDVLPSKEKKKSTAFQESTLNSSSRKSTFKHKYRTQEEIEQAMQSVASRYSKKESVSTGRRMLLIKIKVSLTICPSLFKFTINAYVDNTKGISSQEEFNSAQYGIQRKLNEITSNITSSAKEVLSNVQSRETYTFDVIVGKVDCH